MPLFGGVAYHISDSIPEATRRELGSILHANGATEVALSRATHVVSDTNDFDGADLLTKDVACVTPYWVERSMELGVLQDPKYFSADKEMIFSGIVATSAGIPPGDKEVIIAGIKESGGQWREGLTRDVTHLFVTNTSSKKYETAMHFREAARITILLPQWFDQCWSMQMRLPHKVFEFPDPLYMRKDFDTAAYQAQLLVGEQMVGTTAMLHSLRGGVDDAARVASPTAPTRNIWQNRAILLSSSLSLDVKRRESLEERIHRNGGRVVTVGDKEKDELAAVDRTDVLVTQHRTGLTYARALAQGKMIGTLAWLFCVESSGVVSSPRDRLLHYPSPKQPIEGFEHHLITVTNYQGDKRDYLKKLISLMGATFTPTLSGRNTIVIAAYKGGSKTEKADEWSVPVVTHKWLEDCFVEWRNLTPAQKKYLDYAPGVNYGTVLGHRGVGRVGLEEDFHSPPLDEAAQQKNGVHVANPDKEKSAAKTALTQELTNSGREAREAEEVEDALNTGGADVDNESRPPPNVGEPSVRRRVSTPVKTGPSNDVEKTPVRPESTTTPRPKMKQANDIPPPSRKGKEKAWDSDGEEDSVEELPPKGKEKPQVNQREVRKSAESSVASKSPRSPVKVQKIGKVIIDPGNDDGRGPPSKPSPRKVPPVTSDKDVVENAPNVKTWPASGKEREVIEILDDGSEVNVPERVDETPPRVKSKFTPKTYKSKTKASTRLRVHSSVSDGEESEEESLKKGDDEKVNAHGRASTAQRSPRYALSVELPDPRSLLSSEKTRARTPEHGDPAAELSSPSKELPSARKRPPLFKTMSIRAMAHEALSVGIPRRSRPAAARHDDDTPRSSSSEAATSKYVKGIPEKRGSAPSSPSAQRAHPRRSAAAAATLKLRNEVMPDVVNYEKELKRDARQSPRKRKTSSSAAIETRDGSGSQSESETEARSKKKRKLTSGKKNESKNARKEESEDESDAPVRFVTHVRGNKRPSPTDDEVEDLYPVKKNRRSGTRKKIHSETPNEDSDNPGDEKLPRRSSYDPKKIRILTTKVEIREEVTKALGKLGAKFTEKPTLCTHLVASSYARTEKFLSALSNAPFVLNVSWLLESAAKSVILDETEYLLNDPAMEKKHDFKLSEALQRARELKRKNEKLFQGHFFYATPNVPVDFNLMKNVIQANGGECIQRTPTVRNLSQTRHVISSAEDEDVWQPLAKRGFPIYSKELILTAACAQRVDWDDMNKRVEGSF